MAVIRLKVVAYGGQQQKQNLFLLSNESISSCFMSGRDSLDIEELREKCCCFCSKQNTIESKTFILPYF